MEVSVRRCCARLCIARSDDNSYSQRNLGGSTQPRGTGRDLALNHDVRCSGDANSVFETGDCHGAAARLLRDQCLRFLKELILYACTLPAFGENGGMAGSLDRSDPASIGNGANGTPSTATFVGSKASSDCTNLPEWLTSQQLSRYKRFKVRGRTGDLLRDAL